MAWSAAERCRCSWKTERSANSARQRKNNRKLPFGHEMTGRQFPYFLFIRERGEPKEDSDYSSTPTITEVALTTA